MDLDLDAWLPEPQVRVRHDRAAHASADELWEAAGSMRLCDAPRLGRLVRWRIPGTPPELPYRELFRRYPFTVLAEGERWSISGLCGRLWTLRRDYPRIRGPGDFRQWDEPGTVRVVLAHWVQLDEARAPTLVSESRIKPVDRRGGLRLRALWAVVGPFERLIGGEVLEAAARLAEESTATETGRRQRRP